MANVIPIGSAWKNIDGRRMAVVLEYLTGRPNLKDSVKFTRVWSHPDYDNGDYDIMEWSVPNFLEEYTPMLLQR